MSGFESQKIEKVSIVGVGLIGGSIAGALKERGLARVVTGIGRDKVRLRGAFEQGLVDIVTDSAEEGADADVIVFCTPVERIVAGVREIARYCRPGTIITDAGSVKGTICRELSEGLPKGVSFIGAHPIAGSEKQGYESARSDLFENKVCVVTPQDGCRENELERLKGFWRGIGCQVLTLSPDVHDEILARTSHLPHLVAAALAGTLEPKCTPFVGSGFRDTTRIAAGDSKLWQGILLENSESVLAAARNFDEVWKQMLAALEKKERAKLTELLDDAQRKREGLTS